jgi:hypothetical protein
MASGRKEEVTAKGRARIKVGMDGRGVALLVAMKRRVLIMDIRDRIISHIIFHILSQLFKARGIVHK